MKCLIFVAPPTGSLHWLNQCFCDRSVRMLNQTVFTLYMEINLQMVNFCSIYSKAFTGFYATLRIYFPYPCCFGGTWGPRVWRYWWGMVECGKQVCVRSWELHLMLLYHNLRERDKEKQNELVFLFSVKSTFSHWMHLSWLYSSCWRIVHCSLFTSAKKMLKKVF